MNKRKLILCLVTPATILFSGCKGKTEIEKTEKVMPVKTLTVGCSTTTAERTYVGTAEESFALALSFSAGGTVEQVAVSEGQKVNKGQLLAALNNSTMQNTYGIALSTLK
jgi:multidrug efflux pump subunit AcrA (membrane-fusion protein)